MGLARRVQSMKLLTTSAAVLMGVSILATSSPVFAHAASTKNFKKTSSSSQKVAAADTVSATEKAPEPKTVSVASGEYLEKIANENQSTSLRLFYKNTDISNPDLIFPGQQLTIPTAEENLTPREVPVNQQIAAPTPEESVSAAAPTPAAQPAYVAPVRPATPVATNFVPSDGSVWDRLAQCESGGNWAINTGNGFYGGIQFTTSSWAAVGGSGMPNMASREEQIARGQMLQARQGWGAWPACSAKLGLY